MAVISNCMRLTAAVIMGHVFSMCPGLFPAEVLAELYNSRTLHSKNGSYKARSIRYNRRHKVQQKTKFNSTDELIDEEVKNCSNGIFDGNTFTNSSTLESLLDSPSNFSEFSCELPKTSSRSFRSAKSLPRSQNCFESDGVKKLSRNHFRAMSPLSATIFEGVRPQKEVGGVDIASRTIASSANASYDSLLTDELSHVFVVSSELKIDAIHLKSCVNARCSSACPSASQRPRMDSKNCGPNNSASTTNQIKKFLTPTHGMFFIGPDETESKSHSYFRNGISDEFDERCHQQSSNDYFRIHSVSDRLSPDMAATSLAKFPSHLNVKFSHSFVHSLSASSLPFGFHNTVQRCRMICKVFFLLFG